MGSEGHQDIDLAILTALLKGKSVSVSGEYKNDLNGFAQQLCLLIVDINPDDTMTHSVIDNIRTSPGRHYFCYEILL